MNIRTLENRRNRAKSQTGAKQVGQGGEEEKKRVYRKGTRYERRRKSGRGKRGGGRRRCVWVQRRGCRVTNEILVPFCLQYCRGCIRGKEKGVGQKVGQFHVARGTPCGHY